MVKRVAVIGAGVVGLSCAVKIAESANDKTSIEVSVLSDKFSPNTTGDGSAGLWGPYLTCDTAADKINKWSEECHQFLHEQWKSGKAAELGISLVPVTRLIINGNGFNPSWSRVVFGFSHVSYEQLDRYSREHKVKYVAGAHFVTFVVEPKYFLPYLMQRFQSAGGKVIEKRVNNLDELDQDYDLIVNCTGMGARQLVNDQKVRPIRGQVQRVQASWVFQSTQNDHHYIIPNMESVVLGGTAQFDDFNENANGDDSKHIRTGCLNLDPCLANSTFIKEWVGLRPGRETIRIEEETIRKDDGRTCTIIHNYGHGGCGVTTCWGCASDVLELAKNYLDGISNVKSKL